MEVVTHVVDANVFVCLGLPFFFCLLHGSYDDPPGVLLVLLLLVVVWPLNKLG